MVSGQERGNVAMGRTMRIAYFSPLAPMRSKSSSYSEELLPHLCRRVHVDVFTDDRVAATQEVGRVYPVYGYRDLIWPERYDQRVYQMGNTPEYVPIYNLFTRYGGVVTLHNLDLSGLISAKTLGQGDHWGYLREVQRNGGLRPFLQTASDLLLRGQWSPKALEMNRMVAQRAAGVIVHSRAACQHLKARYPGARVREIPMGMPRPPLIEPAEARRLLHLPADAFIVLSVGRLVPGKRLHVAMQAVARLLERCPNTLYVLVGEPAPDYPVRELAESLGIADHVQLAGHVDLATLYRYLAASDVGICLRDPGRLELPASLLRMMSMGKPVIVSNTPPFAELPATCALKADTGPGEVAQISAALWALSGHAPLRQWYGRSAARFVHTEHTLAAAAQHYAEFLEGLGAVEAAEEIMLREKTI